MDEINPNPAENTLWAYAYEIVPSQAEDRLRAIQALLDEEHLNAKRNARNRGSRVVLEEKITHILVVTDSPDQKLEVNRRLEGELRKLRAGFAITVPMEVGDDATPPPVMELMD